MTAWRDYLAGKDPADHTIVGKLLVRQNVYSPQLDNRRDILVWLPPSYDSEPAWRYPVIYMHDGQNLFDAATSYAGEWQVDETMMALADEGIEAIVVGVPNMADDRVHELSPYRHEYAGKTISEGRGAAYLRFVVETIKSMIDADFRTVIERAGTGIMGSSMGGLISLYGYYRYADVFGFAGVMSPAFWFGDGAMFDMVREGRQVEGRVYLDVGTAEGENMAEDEAEKTELTDEFLQGARQMRDLLVEVGYQSGQTLMYVEDEGAIHHETVWAQRLPEALRFLLKGAE